MMETGLGDGYGGKAERATVTLREMIARGEVLPGQHLRQDQLAQQIGTTRVPVREAFKTLVAEGLLAHRRNLGHFVAQLDSHDLQQLFWLRGVLEDELARTSRWPDAALIAHLRDLNEQIRTLGPHGTAPEITRIDMAFHQATWALSDKSILLGQILRGRRLCGPYRTLIGYVPQIVEEHMVPEHAAIIDALERRDRQAYLRSLADHRKRANEVVDFLREREAAVNGNPLAGVASA